MTAPGPNPNITAPLPRVESRPSAPQSQAVVAHDLNLRFAENTGVFDVSMNVPSGTIFALIGPSGCGKTTTVRILTGVYKAQSGEARVLGDNPAEFHTRTRERIGYLPQQFVLYPNLTVWENLNFVASLYGMNYFKRRKRLNMLLDFVELTDARHRLGSKLSGGMQRRLSLACALVHNPALLFADEPTAGIDPVLRGKFWDYFRQLREQGQTLFVTTQYVGEAAYCDYVGVMRDGRLLFVDTPDGLRHRAFGGEVVRLVVDPDKVMQTQDLIQRANIANDVRRSRRERGLLLLYVVEASEAMPAVVRLLDEHQITARQVEEYLPPFDDVFIVLMQQAEADDA
ncbi:MAG TPA: ABC transporter ATP-binding protein [Roseiflexaceae bacterium]|jgi:ABC-2 type transport system ATP-binding protein|nr:ABC transporter ATP-binding protein [Roseiflexaceae bacterium]